MIEVESKPAQRPISPRRQRFVAAAGIFFGLLGLLHALSAIDLARTMLTDGDWVFEIDKAFHVDPWFAEWQIEVGHLAVAVATVYIAASTLLFLRLRYGVALFRVAASAAIASAVFKAYVASWPDGYLVEFGRSLDIAGCFFSCFVNAGLLLLLSRRWTT